MLDSLNMLLTTTLPTSGCLNLKHGDLKHILINTVLETMQAKSGKDAIFIQRDCNNYL